MDPKTYIFAYPMRSLFGQGSPERCLRPGEIRHYSVG